MVGSRLMHLIEMHSEDLATGLTDKLRQSERTSDFRKIPQEELRRTTAELYRHLGEWLVKKTEKDIEKHFVAIAERRAADGVALRQFVWALVISRNHLYQFLTRNAFADSIFELYSELELQQLLNQFFERATYFGVSGYEESRHEGIGVTVSKVRQGEASAGVMRW